MSFPQMHESIILSQKIEIMYSKSKMIHPQLRNIILLFLYSLFLSILVSCGNRVDKNNANFKKCSENKIDSLIQQIVFIPEVYTPREGVDNKVRFLVLNTLKSKTDSLYGFSKVLFLVQKDSSKYKVGTVTVDSTNFNFDSTSVTIEIGYYILNGYRSSTTYVSYEWNNNLCNWSLMKKTEGIH